MIISTNLSAIFTNEQLNRTSAKAGKSMERLSSGYKINSSADDAVGMALSETMRLQLRGLERASQNASDGVSVVETAEGALQEINSIISRMRELAVQGSSDTYSDEDRVNIQSEIDALKNEIDRITRDTEFNGNAVLDGSLQRNSYVYDTSGTDKVFTKDIELLYFSNETKAGLYDLEYDVVESSPGIFELDATSISLSGEFSNVSGLNFSIEYNTITITGAEDFFMEVSVDEDLSAITAPQQKQLEIKDMGNMIVQLGAKEGQTVGITVPKVSTKTLGLDNLDLTTNTGSEKAIDLLDKALEKVLTIRGHLGAAQNRFEHTISSIDITSETTTKSISRIIDVDMAEEMTTYTSLSVVEQAGISMLAQANQLPEKVLQLLQ